MNRTSLGKNSKQRGVATLIILLLVGIATSAAVFGTLRHIQSTQSQVTTFHAQTQAQIKAWSGVAIVLQYFQQVAENEDPELWQELKELLLDAVAPDNPSPQPVELDIDLSGLTAVVVRADPDPDDDNALRQLWVNINAITNANNDRATASSAIQVVYQIIDGESPPPTTGTPGEPAVITFNRNLRLGGSINVTTRPGEKYAINVQGFVEAINGNSITGVDTINAMDSIHIGSGSSFNTLNSNGDIRLTGSVSGNGHLNALGNICLIGGTSANGQVKANGFIYGQGGASFGDIQAIGNNSYTGGQQLCNSHLLLDSNGAPFAVNMAGNNSVRSVKSKASVRFNSGTVSTIPGLMAEGDLRDTNWGGRQVGIIGGSIENPGNNPQALHDITVSPGYQVDITPLSEVQIEATVFDAYDYAEIANYVFRVNAQGYKVVEVRDIHDIPNGTYYIGSYSTAHKDRLCTGLAGNSTPDNPVCNLPASGAASYPVCRGHSEWNTCFTYSSNTSTWTLNGLSMAQGIAWFEGSLRINNGTYYNTFIATENINTAGSVRNYAPNYAGYSGVVAGTAYAPKGICSNGVSPHYPTQLCNADGTFNADATDGVGNYAFMAGSAQDDAYVGGNIALGSSVTSYGNVLAGNEFNSGGSTTVHGYITALGGGAVTYNTMGGSTNIIVNQLPPTFIPMGDINVGGGTGSCSDNCTLPGNPTLSVFWSRYL